MSAFRCASQCTSAAAGLQTTYLMTNVLNQILAVLLKNSVL